MKRSLIFLLTLVFTCSVFFSVVASGAKPRPVKVTTISGEIIKFSLGASYNNEDIALKTAKVTYILRGKGVYKLNKYIGYSAQMKGIVTAGPQGTKVLTLKSYKIIKKVAAKIPTKAPIPTAIKTIAPTSTPDTGSIVPGTKILVGWLGIIDPVKSRFILENENGVAYELIGEIKGLENRVGEKLEVTGNYVMTFAATEYPLFSVISYKVIDKTKPTTTIITENDGGGCVYVKKGDTVKLILGSNNTTGYRWEVNEPFDKTVLLQTGYEYIIDQKDEKIDGAGGREEWTFNAVGVGTTVTYLSYSRPWESATPYITYGVKVIVQEPLTPTPSYEVLRGTLSVTPIKTVETERIVAGGYKLSLKTENGPCTLIGNVKGLEKYDGAEIEVTGNFGLTEEYPPRFNVLSYVIISTPSPTPSYDVLRGTLSVTPIKTVETERIVAGGYRFLLKTETGTLALQGNVKGLEKYNGKQIEVTGNYTPVQSYPTFNVVSYVVLPATPTLPTEKHTIISDKAMYVSDPTLGINMMNAQGNAAISWTENTQNASFKASITIPELNTEYNYEFELVQATACDSYSIQGIFNIKRNGVLVAGEVSGSLYGLNAQVGSYFKFYSAGESWHLSAYVTSRTDI